MTTTLRVQRYVGTVLAVLLLSACQTKSKLPEPGAEVPTSDASTSMESTGKALRRLAPTTLPLLTTPGTWLRPPQGPVFEPMDTLDPRNAMIYVYRPHTSWEDQELQAPTFFVDGTKVFGLKSGSYTWLEVHAGNYKLYAKRPLLILFIKKIFELEMDIQGGHNYYFRYSEDAPFDYAAEGLKAGDFLQAGFLQQVPESVALVEIASLQLDQQGVYFEAGRIARQRWAPFEAFPETGTDPDEVASAAAADADPGSQPAGEAKKETFWDKTRTFFGSTKSFFKNRF